MSNEFSELQAVDFGLGAFIAAAFSDLNPDRGPKGYREFLSRPANRQIYRHDADTPKDFVQAFLAAQAAAKTAAGAKINLIEMPLVYYFRKPGLTNGTDREATRRGRYVWSEGEEELLNAYQFMVLPLVLDYRMFFLAWDKPTLDKLQLAWYAYASRHDKFTCRYRLGSEDIFEISAFMQDHKSLLCSDESVPPGQDTRRVYAVSAGMQIATDVIVGAGAEPPEAVTITGILWHYLDHATGSERDG